MKDENDKAMEGTLPSDPTADAVPMMSPSAEQLQREAPAIGSIALKAIGQMQRRMTGDEGPIPIPWPTLGRRMAGGFWPGCHVLVGNTGTGKSQFALQVVLNAARQGIPCLYVGLELGQTGLVARLLGLMAKVRWSRLFLGQHEDSSVFHKYMPDLEWLPIHLVTMDSFSWSYENLEPQVAALKAAYPEEKNVLVVVDYLQLVASPASAIGQSSRERIGKASAAARDVARKHNAAVLLLSSTARNNYELVGGHTSKDNKVPAWKGPPARMVGLGKESGEVEFSADSVLALVREPWPKDGPRPKETTMHVAIAKLRAGTTSWTKLNFNGGRFAEAMVQDTTEEERVAAMVRDRA